MVKTVARPALVREGSEEEEEGVSAREDEDSNKIGSEEAGLDSMEAD